MTNMKPLVWAANDKGYVAQSVLGTYWVFQHDGEWFWSKVGFRLVDPGKMMIGPIEAKAAAQAHYDSAILSALVPPPIRGGTGEALAWAMDEIDVLSNKLCGFAYPQGMGFLGRSAAQASNYTKAVEARRALSTSPVPTGGETVMDARNAGIEEAAKLVEDNHIVDSNNGQELAPRSEGNRNGLAYAAAIRALTQSSERTP